MLRSVYAVWRCCCAAVEGHASLGRLSGPHLSKYSTYRSALPVCATRKSRCRGFFVLSTGFCEECLPGGRCFCRVVTFREVN